MDILILILVKSNIVSHFKQMNLIIHFSHDATNEKTMFLY
jgi:hypothetical protein